jgi:tRNA (cmo5U34)-methyltransferase
MKDNIISEGKWVFDEEVANCFEDMLQRSIPQYEIMRKLTFELGSFFLKDKKWFSLLDVGCSNGLGLVDYIRRFGAHGQYLGIDCSEAMLKKAEEKFHNYCEVGVCNFMNIDLRESFPVGSYDIIQSILSIMFIPIQYRQSIIQSIYDNLKPDGCFLFVEKVLGNSAKIDELLVDKYYDMKRQNGYTEEQIMRKKLSLEGVQVPVTSNWNVDLLKQAGFRYIDVYWRYLNFVGYIAIK